MFKKYFIFAAAAVLAAGCSGGSRDVPATPASPSSTGSSSITAPTIDSPSDDTQLDTLRPTLTVNNATSSGSGSRSYEIQIADNTGFAIVPGRFAAFTVAYTQSGLPEGAGGKTSLAVPTDLLPATRYYWRARAIQGANIGPWSNTSRLKTKIESFKSGNQVFDILTNGRTVADLQRRVFFIDDQSPGLKLDDSDSYLGYRISALPEGEVSFIARRIKPAGDSSFNGQSKILLMQDGTGSTNLGGNQHRVLVDRFWNTGHVRFEFRNNNAGGDSASSGQSWRDHFPYFLKLEWRGGTARFRVFEGETEGTSAKVDLTTSYTGQYNPPNHTVIIGSLYNDTMRDMRVSRVYIGPNPRPVSLGSALNAQ